MKKIFVSLFFLLSLCFGVDSSPNFQSDTKNEQSSDFFNPGVKKDAQEEQQEIKFTQKTKSKYIFTSFSQELPKTSYTNQLIPLSVKATVTTDFNHIAISSTNETIGAIYPTDLEWEKIDENNYQKIVYFQANTPATSIPSLKVDFETKDGIKDTTYLPPQKIDIIDIKDDDGKFINIFAKSLHVSNFKTNRFDEDSLIMVIEFKAQEANLNKIHFNNFEKQGVDSTSGSFLEKTVYYFLIFKEGIHNIEFSYFNLENNNFKTIKLPVTISENELSTHIGLNPKKSVFELYKDIGMGAMALFFVIIFFFRKRYLYLIIALLFAGALTYKKVSFADIIIKDNTKVRILPTEDSTIFFTTTNPTEVEKLNQVKHYIKVLLPNGKIGWVKEDDIIKN